MTLALRHASCSPRSSNPHWSRLCVASIQGGAALAPESSPPLALLGRRRRPRPPPLPGSLCADRDGFSLHAKVLVPAGELERLEQPVGSDKPANSAFQLLAGTNRDLEA